MAKEEPPVPTPRPRVSSLLLAIALLAPGPPPPPAEAQAKPCKDTPPEDCTRTKALGEDSSGCACFVCNPDGPNRKVVCTTDEVVKKKMRALANPS
jgi:hypothetical protein